MVNRKLANHRVEIDFSTRESQVLPDWAEPNMAGPGRRMLCALIRQFLFPRPVNVRASVRPLRYLCKSGRMHLSAEPVELLEVHDQWRPLVRIDTIGVTFHEQIRMDVDALDPHFDQADEAAQFVTVFANAVNCRNDSFELNWTFECARCLDSIGPHPRSPR